MFPNVLNSKENSKIMIVPWNFSVYLDGWFSFYATNKRTVINITLELKLGVATCMCLLRLSPVETIYLAFQISRFLSNLFGHC